MDRICLPGGKMRRKKNSCVWEVFVMGTSWFVSNRHLLLQPTECSQDQKCLLWAQVYLFQTDICCFSPQSTIKTRSICYGHELICFKQKFAASIEQSVWSRPEVFVEGTCWLISNRHDQDQKRVGNHSIFESEQLYTLTPSGSQKMEYCCLLGRETSYANVGKLFLQYKVQRQWRCESLSQKDLLCFLFMHRDLSDIYCKCFKMIYALQWLISQAQASELRSCFNISNTHTCTNTHTHTH